MICGMQRPILDRIPSFDARSRTFPIRSLVSPTARIRKRVWTPRSEPLDQGPDGACVGFSWSHELAATPVRREVTVASAFQLYARAREFDQAMGNHWPAGASVLAGAKACKADGFISAYYWAFGIEDVIAALVAKGPVVLGINWYDSMFSTDHNGLIPVGGNFVGGHAILAYGYWPQHPKIGDDVIAVQQSWGPAYGLGGRAFFRVTDLARLLSESGEACVPRDIRPEPEIVW